MNDMPPGTSITDKERESWVWKKPYWSQKERDDLERFCGTTGLRVERILHAASIQLAPENHATMPIQ